MLIYNANLKLWTLYYKAQGIMHYLNKKGIILLKSSAADFFLFKSTLNDDRLISKQKHIFAK